MNEKKETPVSSARKPVFQSEDLFKNGREIIIVHGESEYRLLITKAGKLILNK